jgi:hypothetical protein
MNTSFLIKLILEPFCLHHKLQSIPIPDNKNDAIITGCVLML